jgi:alpha-D-ribose 1-methylphosphonate 5-phosphate C-P lyase
MTIPVWVEQQNGRFMASVLGAPQVSADASTKEQAVAAVTALFQNRMTSGEVVIVNVPTPLPFRQVSPEETEAWRELREEIYRERDAQKAAEWPE